MAAFDAGRSGRVKVRSFGVRAREPLSSRVRWLMRRGKKAERKDSSDRFRHRGGSVDLKSQN